MSERSNEVHFQRGRLLLRRACLVMWPARSTAFVLLKIGYASFLVRMAGHPPIGARRSFPTSFKTSGITISCVRAFPAWAILATGMACHFPASGFGTERTPTARCARWCSSSPSLLTAGLSSALAAPRNPGASTFHAISGETRTKSSKSSGGWDTTALRRRSRA